MTGIGVSPFQWSRVSSHRRQRRRWLGLLLGFLRGRVRKEPGAFLLAALLPYQVEEGPARAAPAIASTGQHAPIAFNGQVSAKMT